MSSFSVEAGTRWDALALQHQLARFSPWLVELRRDEWYVQGTFNGLSISDLEREVAAWGEERNLPTIPIEVVDGSTAPGPGSDDTPA